MYKIIVFVPLEYKEILKQSLFAVGAGRIGNYDCCCFETKGTGQFRPIKGARPFIGELGKVENVDEVRIEMVCKSQDLKNSILALKENHPYECPAYDIIKLEQEPY